VLEKLTKEEILQLPASFQFDNCEYYGEYAILLEKYIKEQME
jgi:hypothetical protein